MQIKCNTIFLSVQSSFISLIGDYSFDPLKLGAKPANLEKYKISELKNGRLAMLAFSGIVTQAALTGKGFPCELPAAYLPINNASIETFYFNLF